MDGEDAHRVVVGLGQHRLDDPGALGCSAASAQCEERRAGCRPRPRRTPAPGRRRTARAATGRAGGRRRTRPRARAARARCGRAARWARATSRASCQLARARAMRVADRMVVGQGLGERRLVVPPAAVLDLVREEVVVAAAEQRRAQRGHQRELVGGIVDRLQHHEQVADLAGAVDQRRRLGPVRDAGRVERVLELAERRAGGQQDADVAEPARLASSRAVGVGRATCQSSRSAVTIAATTSPASRSRSASASALVVVRRRRRAARPAGPTGGVAAHGLERDVLGLRRRASAGDAARRTRG